MYLLSPAVYLIVPLAVMKTIHHLITTGHKRYYTSAGNTFCRLHNPTWGKNREFMLLLWLIRLIFVYLYSRGKRQRTEIEHLMKWWWNDVVAHALRNELWNFCSHFFFSKKKDKLSFIIDKSTPERWIILISTTTLFHRGCLAAGLWISFTSFDVFPCSSRLSIYILTYLHWLRAVHIKWNHLWGWETFLLQLYWDVVPHSLKHMFCLLLHHLGVWILLY